MASLRGRSPSKFSVLPTKAGLRPYTHEACPFMASPCSRGARGLHKLLYEGEARVGSLHFLRKPGEARNARESCPSWQSHPLAKLGCHAPLLIIEGEALDTLKRLALRDLSVAPSSNWPPPSPACPPNARG